MSGKDEDEQKPRKEEKLFMTETSQLEKSEQDKEKEAVAAELMRPKSSKINSATTNDLATADDADEDDDDDDVDDEELDDDEEEEELRDGEDEPEDDDEQEGEEEDEEDEDDDDEYDEYMEEYPDNPFYEYQLPAPTIEGKAGDSKIDEDENGSAGDEQQQDEMEVRALSAVAPKIFQQDDSGAQVEISSTPAFQCLEELFQSGKLTGTQVAQLKAKYIELHRTLKKSRENEARLMRESKEYLKKIDHHKEILQKADAFPDNLNNEVLKLRAQFLKYENDAACSEERLYNLEYKLSGLEEDKGILEREYARMPKPHELERQIEQLKHQNKELTREIAQRQEEIIGLKKSIEVKNVEVDQKKKELNELLESVEDHKNEYVNVNLQPYQIAKEIDKLSTEKDEVNKEIHRIENELKIFSAQLSEAEKQLMEHEDKNNELLSIVNKEKNSCFEREKELNDKTKEFEMHKEREVVLLSDKAVLELALKHAAAEKKLEKEAYLKAQKENEKESRNVKKLELQLKACQDSLTNVTLAYEKVLEQKKAQPQIDETSLIEKRNQLRKEVEQLSKEVNKQFALTNIQKVEVETRIETEEHLLFEQSNFRIEAVEATRLAAIKADEKEQKAREFVKAETRYKKALEDVKVKDNLIDEHQKRLRELKLKLKDFAKMYDVIKSDRNKCVNQIQISTQRAAEMKEKLKILGNEFEILRTSVAQKEKQLQRQVLKYINAISVRDSIRNEKEKQREQLEKLRDQYEQQKMNISNYNAIVTSNEQEAIRMRRRYEECVRVRNARGIDVIKRSEEVCVICERANVQASVIKNGQLELVAREQEARLLDVKKREEERVVALLRKRVPEEEEMRERLTQLRQQLIECQDYVVKLENQVEDCTNPERIRLLDGPEESVDELMQKLEKIELKLVKVEEQCLEKDLILEQVNRITNRIENKVGTNKDDTLTLAKKINKMQGDIKETTKKMMACVSELSIAQAEALRLQEEAKSKEILLEKCLNRMQMGEPPSDDIEAEYQRLIALEERARNKSNTIIETEKDTYTMPDGYVTTAEPRPNAYIPQNDIELPIPKPYGKHAPFKPQDPGSTMRHIKKPNPKPIEI